MSDVVFRRVRGRVIPIKSNKAAAKSQNSTAIGVAKLIGGAALAVGGAYAAAHLASKSKMFLAKASIYSRKAREIYGATSPESLPANISKIGRYSQKAFRNSGIADKLWKGALGLQGASTVVGARLAYKGTQDILGKKNGNIIPSATVSAGVSYAGLKIFNNQRFLKAFPFILRGI